jgi:hypothetical protein
MNATEFAEYWQDIHTESVLACVSLTAFLGKVSLGQVLEDNDLMQALIDIRCRMERLLENDTLKGLPVIGRRSKSF